MNKRYEAPGMMEWHPVIAVGRSRLRIPFEGGFFSGRGQSPAIFETSDEALQTMIEASALYEKGRIRLAPGFTPGAAAKETGKRSAARKMEFANLEQARDYLIMQKGAKRTSLLTASGCVETAAEFGIALNIKEDKEASPSDIATQ